MIIGILIALSVSNWREEQKDQQYLRQINNSINLELEESLEDIAASIPKQQTLIDSIGYYMNDESISIFDIITRSGGIQRPTIITSSWKAIANTKIELIDFEQIATLTEIEESKDLIELKSEKLVDYIFENLKSTDPEKKEIFFLFSQEMLSTTKYTLSEVETYLANVREE